MPIASRAIEVYLELYIFFSKGFPPQCVSTASIVSYNHWFNVDCCQEVVWDCEDKNEKVGLMIIFNAVIVVYAI